MVNVNENLNEQSGEINFIKQPAVKASIPPLNSPDTEVDVSDTPLSIHNTSAIAHKNLFELVYEKFNQILATLNLKANSVDIYTKTESDTKLEEKIDVTDPNVTKQGNSFNASNQLVQLTTEGKLPQLDGINLTNVAKLSLENINSTAKNFISQAGMIGNNSINYTLGSSGSTYTAPAHGYYYIEKNAGSTAWVGLWATNITAGIVQSAWCYTNGNWCSQLFVPVRKGDVLKVEYTHTGVTNSFKFIYASSAS